MPKPPERLEYVRCHCGQDLFDLARVSPEAELAHRRLAEFYWHTGQWPSTLRGNAAALARVPIRRWPSVIAELTTLNWVSSRGKLTSSRIQKVRKQAIAALKSRRNGGRLGAKRRWTPQRKGGKALPAHGSADGSAMGNPKVTYGSPMGVQCLVKGKSKSNSKSTSSTLKAFNDERLTCIVSAPEKSSGKEKTFLREVQEMLLLWSPAFAKDELANWGGWWRNRFRETPAKAQRLVAELRGMIREGRVSGNPGAAAVDLWNRLP